MNGLVVMVFLLVVLYSANVAWKNYLQAQTEQARAKATVLMRQEETKRLQILSDAIKAEHQLRLISEP
jgi:hypothetical protein